MKHFYGLLATYIALSVSAAAQSAVQTSLEIDWGAARAAAVADADKDKAGVETFRAASPGDLSEVRLPVLVPGTGPVRAKPRLKADGVIYSAIYDLDRGATLSIMGSAQGVSIPDALNGTSAPAFTLLDDEENGSEAIAKEADYSFLRFGASYTLRLSCTELGDVRCIKEDFAKSVADSLVQVGGAQR